MDQFDPTDVHAGSKGEKIYADTEWEKASKICDTITIKTPIFDELGQKPVLAFVQENELCECTSAKPENIDDWRKRGTHVCTVMVDTNAGEEENENYVSIILIISNPFLFFEGFCIVSVIDSAKEQRFSKTYSISHSATFIFLRKYISRKQLLDEPDELVPNGILTMLIDVELMVTENYPNEMHIQKQMNHPKENNVQIRSVEGFEHFLLDSPLAQRLAEESDFFRAILELPMIEKRTKLMAVEEEEAAILDRWIAKLVMGDNSIIFFFLKDIFDVYIMADKYQIPLVSETCTCFLKLYAAAWGSVDDLTKCVNEYDDDDLKEILISLITFVSNTNFEEEIIKTDIGISMKKPVHKKFWTYRYPEQANDAKFSFKNTATQCKFNEGEVGERELLKNRKNEYDIYQ